MTGVTEEVGAFEAKTRLSELLRETEGGKTFIIRRRGKEVARLVPPRRVDIAAPADLAAEFRMVRRRVRGMIKVGDLIDTGRRF